MVREVGSWTSGWCGALALGTNSRQQSTRVRDRFWARNSAREPGKCLNEAVDMHRNIRRLQLLANLNERHPADVHRELASRAGHARRPARQKECSMNNKVACTSASSAITLDNINLQRPSVWRLHTTIRRADSRGMKGKSGWSPRCRKLRRLVDSYHGMVTSDAIVSTFCS